MTSILDVTMLPPPVIDVIAGGPQGPPGPIGPAGGPMAGYATPRQFGAVGDGVHDDTAAVIAAEASLQSSGGMLYFDPGNYRCTTQLVYHPKVTWSGAGSGASIITLDRDLWAGGTALAAQFLMPVSNSAFGQSSPFMIRDLRIQGPGGGSLGQSGCKTNGLRSSSGIVLERVFISGFFAGVENITDHEIYRNLYSTGNYYGISFSDAYYTSGNQSFYSCKLNGNNLASVHVSGPNLIGNATFVQTHFGYGPVGILRTDAQNTTTPWDGQGNPIYTGTPANNRAITNSYFASPNFEAVGNGAIIDTTSATSLQMLFTTRMDAFWMSWKAQYKTTNAPLGNTDWQGAWAMYWGNADPSGVIECASGPLAGSLGAFKSLNGAGPQLRLSTFPPNMFGSGTTWSGAVNGRWFIDYATGGAGGRCVVCPTSSVIAVGDCVELTTSGAVQRATGAKPCYGVAMTASAASGSSVVVVMIDGIAPLNAAVGSIPVGTPLYLNATTHYQVDNTSTTQPVVGVALNAGGATSVLARLAPVAA